MSGGSSGASAGGSVVSFEASVASRGSTCAASASVVPADPAVAPVTSSTVGPEREHADTEARTNRTRTSKQSSMVCGETFHARQEGRSQRRPVIDRYPGHDTAVLCAFNRWWTLTGWASTKTGWALGLAR